MTPIKWFYSFIKKYRSLIFGGLFLTTIVSALSMVNPIIYGMIVDDVIYNNEEYKLLPLVICLILSTLIISILRFIYQYWFEQAGQGILYDMRNKVYRKFMMEDFRFYQKKRTGDLMSRLTGDMDYIRYFIAFSIYTTYQSVLFFIFAVIMIFAIDSRIMLMMLCVVPLTILNSHLHTSRLKPLSMNSRNCFAALNSFVQENISGNRVVRAFAKEDYELEKFTKHNDNFREAQIQISKIWKFTVPIFEMFTYLLTIILMLYGGYLTIQGELSMGDLVMVNSYMGMLVSPIRSLGWRINDVVNFTTCLEKIHSTYIEEPRVKTPKRGISKKRYNGAVEFKNVSYRADDEDIVMDINFRVEPGQTVGIIGAVGSGKSTIMNLLCRFFDTTSGQVLIDNTDVRDLNLYNLRDNIGMAMQEIFLFSDTIEGNIAYGRPNCSFEEVKKAAIMADANHFIKDLPDGYDTIVGERGVGLSGGQKQRISLARALLKDPSILILDDTTSAVDMETESYIQKQLKNINHACTTFIIAYRISSVKDADLILVMDNGKIVESGTHEQLIKKHGYYAKTFLSQYGDIPEEITAKKGDN